MQIGTGANASAFPIARYTAGRLAAPTHAFFASTLD
jgi:hypothetical protein